MNVYLFALLLGVITGLRSMAAPTAVSFAARMDRLNLGGTWLAWLGYSWTPWILLVFAVAELIADQLPTTPSRKEAVGFSARVFGGMLAGAAIGIGYGATVGGIVAGAIGAVIGTYGGHALRMRMAQAFGRDRPAALIEDALAYLGAVIIVSSLP